MFELFVIIYLEQQPQPVLRRWPGGAFETRTACEAEASKQFQIIESNGTAYGLKRGADYDIELQCVPSAPRVSV